MSAHAPRDAGAKRPWPAQGTNPSLSFEPLALLSSSA